MEEKEYYYLNGDTKVGPFSLEALKKAPINPDTLVWNSTLPDWVAARTLSELQDFFATAASQPTQQATTYNQQEPTYNTNSAASSYNTGSSYNANANAFNDPNIKPPMPDNYLAWAIISTVFCCWPLGIVSIINSVKVGSAYAAGDYAGAEKASSDAKKFATWSAIGAVIFWVLYILFFVVIGVASSDY